MIFFDLDGVVIHSPRLFSERLEEEYGIKLEKVLPFFIGVFKECSVGKADLKIELAKVIGDWGWKGTVEELMEFWFTKGSVVNQEIIDFIQSLRARGVKCYLTTDQGKYRGEYFEKELGAGKFFERVFFSAEIGVVKKDPQFFETVYQMLGATIPKKEILVVDDDVKNIQVVEQLGFSTHFYSGLERLKKIVV